MFNCNYICLPLFACACSPMFIHVYSSLAMFTLFHICGIAGENRPTGAKFPMEIIDL